MNTLVPDVLALDCEAEASRICRRLRESLRELGRQGLVVAMSGGIDSSVSAALAVRAIGPQRYKGERRANQRFGASRKADLRRWPLPPCAAGSA